MQTYRFLSLVGVLACFGCVPQLVLGFGNYCGDGNLAGSEQCDDGNYDNRDGCDMNCKIELNACGDGNIDEAAGEQCDDGNKLEGDGCSAECQLEPGSTLDMYSRFLDVLVEHSAPCGLGAEVFATPKVMKTAYARNTKAVNLLKTACIIDGYSKGGMKSYQGMAPLGVGEAIKILTKLEALKSKTSFKEHGVANTLLPFKDVNPVAWYSPYIAQAYQIGLLDGFRTSTLKPATAIKPAALLQMFANLGLETENYRRELSLQDRIAREEFAGIVYEQYAKTLDTYAVTNGNNPLVLARIHTNMGMKPTTEHRAFLLLMRKRLAAMDADFMMSEYTIDTRSLVKFLDLVLAEKK